MSVFSVGANNVGEQLRAAALGVGGTLKKDPFEQALSDLLDRDQKELMTRLSQKMMQHPYGGGLSAGPLQPSKLPYPLPWESDAKVKGGFTGEHFTGKTPEECAEIANRVYEAMERMKAGNKK